MVAGEIPGLVMKQAAGRTPGAPASRRSLDAGNRAGGEPRTGVSRSLDEHPASAIGRGQGEG